MTWIINSACGALPNRLSCRRRIRQCNLCRAATDRFYRRGSLRPLWRRLATLRTAGDAGRQR
jgi:hypothetical protein